MFGIILDVQEYRPHQQGRLPSTLVVRFECLFSVIRLLTSFLRFRNILLSYLVWLIATRTAKLLPHLWNRPQDIIYVPAFILFGYYFAIMKIYALFTLHEACPFLPYSHANFD
jgi:hypothetical protein